MKIIVSAEGLTPDDYSQSGCDAALACNPRRCNSDYCVALYQRMEEAKGAGDERTAAVCHVLLAVMMSHAPWNGQAPPAADDPVILTRELDEGALVFLRNILTLIADHEVRARAGDLLYQRSIGKGRKRDIIAAEIAVRAYLADAVQLEGLYGHLAEAERRLRRAFAMAAELNHRALRQEVVSYVERALAAHSAPITADSTKEPMGESPSRYPAQLMKLLLSYQERDRNCYAALAERLAYEARAAKAWNVSREYFTVAAEWYARSEDYVQELAARSCAAEVWVEQGESMVANPDTPDLPFLMAEHKLRQAIAAFRAAKGLAVTRGLADIATRLETRIEEVRRLHLRYQERGVASLLMYGETISVDSSAIFAAVEGKSKLEALFAMTDVTIPARTDVEAMVRDEQRKYLISSLFSLVQLDERGRTTARSDSGIGDADLWARMCQRAATLYELGAQLHVAPQRWMIEINHTVELDDFVYIVRASPFVPLGREPLFARGLYAGMHGDIRLAIHLLIPQVEHAAREIVRVAVATDAGLAPSNSGKLANPEMPSLGEALREPWSNELARFLGEDGDDVVFALRVLLIERFGGNLRNRVFHGLTGPGGVESWQGWYLWWLVLKVCCSTALAAARRVSTSGDS